MQIRIHGIPEEVVIGDLVQTSHGTGTVTAVSEPTSERGRAMLEVDLGRKWMTMDEVTAIVLRTQGERRRSPAMSWDEHE